MWGCCIEKAVAGCVGVLYRKRRWLGVWVCCIENGGGWVCCKENGGGWVCCKENGGGLVC